MFKKINISELTINPFEKIGKEWMLITAGSKDSYNTMTASWGQIGVLWNRDVLTCYIRPNRYTYEFIEKEEYFTASFFGSEYKKALSFCGTHSGRDTDKAVEAGLTAEEIESSTTFKEAELVLVCRKLYSYDIKGENFLTDDGIAEKVYNPEPFHRAYISEITGIYIKE